MSFLPNNIEAEPSRPRESRESVSESPRDALAQLRDDVEEGRMQEYIEEHLQETITGIIVYLVAL